MGFNVDKNDFKELKKLFCEIFSEDEKFVDMMFENKFDCDHIFVIRDNNEIVCATYGIYFDCKVGSVTGKCVYIYGVGTKSAYRGKGYVKKIFDYIVEYYKKKDVLFLYLVPSNASLFNMYEKFGYKTAFYLDKIEVDLKVATTDAIINTSNEYQFSSSKSKQDFSDHLRMTGTEVIPISSTSNTVTKLDKGNFHNDYLEFIKRFDTVVIRSELDNKLALDECVYEKINDSGYLYYIKDHTAIIRECFFDAQSNLDIFLEKLANMNLEKAILTQYKGAKTPYAMVYPLSDLISIDAFSDNSYTNMNFD